MNLNSPNLVLSGGALQYRLPGGVSFPAKRSLNREIIPGYEDGKRFRRRTKRRTKYKDAIGKRAHDLMVQNHRGKKRDFERDHKEELHKVGATVRDFIENVGSGRPYQPRKRRRVGRKGGRRQPEAQQQPAQPEAKQDDIEVEDEYKPELDLSEQFAGDVDQDELDAMKPIAQDPHDLTAEERAITQPMGTAVEPVDPSQPSAEEALASQVAA